MFNTHFLVTRQDITRSSWQHLIHSVGNGVAGVQLDGGEDSLTGRGSGSKGSSISSSGNWGSWEKTSGKSSEESSLGLSNLGGVDNRGSSVDGGNWESCVVNRSNSESEVIGNIVDSVDSSLVSIGVGSSHSSVSISLLLLGRVDVLVSVGKVAKLILSLELRADWASDRGGKRSSSDGNGSSSVSSRGSSNGDWGSGISSRGSSYSNGGSSILSSNNGDCSSKSRSSSNGSSSEGSSIKSSYGGSVGKLGVNSSGHWGSISSSIGSGSSVTVCSVIKTSSSQVLSSNRELSLGSSCGQDGRDDSK